MALSRATNSILRCNSCRSVFYKSLAYIDGLESISAQRSPISHTISRPQARTFSATKCFQSENVSRKAQSTPGLAGLEVVGVEEDVESKLEGRPAQPSTESSLPWYLRIQEQERQTKESSRSLADRQRLPDLPPEPPPILQTLLEHISIDLGLDDLTLLDLRNLDPPAALGANLLMVVGTARSEKHLHVSADRFCRYLRTTHKLRAHADGLLGRAELKIRLRRQARRAKLFANVGAMETRPNDDIRTGWVCVLIDGIEPSPDWESSVPRRDDIVGFDERSDKVTLAVQMFTEQKREEIDLEKLWTGRSQRAEKEMSGEIEEEAVQEDVEEHVKPDKRHITRFDAQELRPQISESSGGQLREVNFG